MNRREQQDKEMFVANAYQNFQLLQVTFLQDEDALLQLAKDRKKEPKEVKESSISSLWINQALHLFQLYEGGHLNPEVWKRFQIDMKGLFARPSVHKRWEMVKKFYPVSYQKFVDSIRSV